MKLFIYLKYLYNILHYNVLYCIMNVHQKKEEETLDQISSLIMIFFIFSCIWTIKSLAIRAKMQLDEALTIEQSLDWADWIALQVYIDWITSKGHQISMGHRASKWYMGRWVMFRHVVNVCLPALRGKLLGYTSIYSQDRILIPIHKSNFSFQYCNHWIFFPRSN